MIIGKVGPLEAAVAARGLVEDRDMRLDPAFTEHFQQKPVPDVIRDGERFCV